MTFHSPMKLLLLVPAILAETLIVPYSRDQAGVITYNVGEYSINSTGTETNIRINTIASTNKSSNADTNSVASNAYPRQGTARVTPGRGGTGVHYAPQDEEALETDECWQFTWPGPLPEDDPNGEDAACE